MGPSSAAGLQPENPKCGRVATAHRRGMGTPGPARDRQRSQTVESTFVYLFSQNMKSCKSSTSSLLCGCEGRTYLLDCGVNYADFDEWLTEEKSKI